MREFSNGLGRSQGIVKYTMQHPVTTPSFPRVNPALILYSCEYYCNREGPSGPTWLLSELALGATSSVPICAKHVVVVEARD